MKWNDRLLQAFERAKEERKITQTDLADYCGIKPASVSGWFSGGTLNIEARYLLPACKFLQVSPFWVMMGDDSDFSFDQIAEANPVNAIDVVHLITAFANSSDEGRRKILAVTEETKKLFPR